MASDKELADFLASVERRAFKQALYAVRDSEAALDIVQDAMVRLATKYGDKPAIELLPLFQRILQNIILDHFRRQKKRSASVSLFSSLLANRDADQEESDWLETLHTEHAGSHVPSGQDQLERSQVLQIIDSAIQELPVRQRQAFLMRYWEEMDVAETAAAMGCSEGSVKTHCSRAVHSLAARLKAKGVSL